MAASLAAWQLQMLIWLYSWQKGRSQMSCPAVLACWFCLDNDWGGKAVQLQAGRVVIEEQHFTHYSIVQLMSAAGLLLQQKSAQMVQLRVAAEFLSVAAHKHPLTTGHWSQKAYNLRVTPGVEPAAALPAHAHLGQEVHSQLQCCLQQLWGSVSWFVCGQGRLRIR